MGLRPLFLCDLRNYQADTRKQILRYPHIDVATRSAGELLAQLESLLPREQIAGVMTFLDSRLAVAVELAERLGCSGMDPAVLDTRSKGWVAWALPEHSPRTLAFQRSRLDAAVLERFLSSCPHGAILKPQNAAGAIGMVRVERSPDLAHALDQVRQTEIPDFLAPDEWIIQELATGELASVEGYVCEGQVRFLGLTGRRKVGATESVMFFPYQSAVSALAFARARQAVEALVARSGFRRGYFHCEFIIDGDDARLIDANVGRLGGGSLGEQLAVAMGLAPVELYRHAIEVTLFGRDSFETRDLDAMRSTLGVMYGLERSEILDAVEIHEPLRSFHTQVLDGGGMVPAMGVNNWSWVGILAGRTDDVEADLAKIRIRVGEQTYPPMY
jgi:hypothetical protein